MRSTPYELQEYSGILVHFLSETNGDDSPTKRMNTNNDNDTLI